MDGSLTWRHLSRLATERALSKAKSLTLRLSTARPEWMTIGPKIEVLQTKMESLSLMVASIPRHLFFAPSFQTSGQRQTLRATPLWLPYTSNRGGLGEYVMAVLCGISNQPPNYSNTVNNKLAVINCVYTSPQIW